MDLLYIFIDDFCDLFIVECIQKVSMADQLSLRLDGIEYLEYLFLLLGIESRFEQIQ